LRFYTITAIVLIGVGSIFYSMLPGTEKQPIVKSTGIGTKGMVQIDMREAKITPGVDSRGMSEQIISTKRKRTDSVLISKIHKPDRKAVQRRSQKILAARRAYQAERHKWRRALNEAYQKAKKTGDYSEYDQLKEMEPSKSFFLE